MHVLFIDTVHPFLKESLSKNGYVIHEGYDLTLEECADFFLSHEGGLVIRGRFNLDRQWLLSARGLKFIARFGSGMEHIDLACASTLGIHCLSSPEGNRDALGDHCLGMLLMLLNKLHLVNEDVRNGIWQREENRGTELGSLKVAIIGYGNMGSAFAKRLSGFDCEVLVHDPNKTDLSFPSSFFRQVLMDEIFEKADVVSYHVPLNEETLGLVNRDYLMRFKNPIILINSSRGPVVQTSALLDGFSCGIIRGACLDVLDFEESNFESLQTLNKNPDWQQLIARNDVVLSPHIAGWSHQSNLKMAQILLKKILALPQKKSP
jgi:D-3-phosphoglycerate dehydrogenase